MSGEHMAEDGEQGMMDVTQPPPGEVEETVPKTEAGLGDEMMGSEAVEGVGTPPSDGMEDALPSLEEIVGVLRKAREDVGQICELSAEEEKLVEAFSLALLKLMRPLAKAIPVDPSVLSGDLRDVEGANIVPGGGLLVLHGDGRMESIDLRDEANRDLLVAVARDVMPKFNDLIAERRAKIESRMSFLMSVTRELQNISEALSSAMG